MKKKSRSGKSKLGKILNPRSRFSERRLTSRAGLILMSRFMDRLGIEGIIDRSVNIDRGTTAMTSEKFLLDVRRVSFDELMVRRMFGT